VNPCSDRLQKYFRRDRLFSSRVVHRSFCEKTLQTTAARPCVCPVKHSALGSAVVAGLDTGADE